MNATDAPYRFHAFAVSYFSAKVRPALRYKQLWVDEVRADLGEIFKRTGLGFIPVVITPEDETWQDSSDIYDRLEARHPEPPLFPTSPVHRIASHLLELYADEVALIPAMHYRWGSELGEASARARFCAMIGDTTVGNKAADRMASARHAVGAAPEAGEAIEAHTRDLLDTLNAHFQAHPYILGERMCFADCALMGPIDGHFFTDLVSRRLLLETAAPVVGWIERCNSPDSRNQGEWLSDDALPGTLQNVLEVTGRDGAPIVMESIRMVEAWADENKGADELPRAVGKAEPTLRGVSVPRAAQTYTLFSVQRVLDALSGFDADQRAAIERSVAGTGWEEVLSHTPRHRMVRDGFTLKLA